jgi:RNA polymerase sigma factor (sigma-70 family)
MYDRLSPEALFVEHLAWIDRVASMTCSRYGVWGAEAEDFTAWVRMKLMENDYAILRRFQGNSELKTYLASVVFRHVVSLIRAMRGRWRPSAAARRLGPPAADLELLVHRDRYTLRQAGEKLRVAGRTTLSDVELARLLERLPKRGPLRPQEVELDAAPGVLHADERVRAAEAAAHYEKAMAALRRAMQQLEAEDRLIVQMYFADGNSLADVARGLGLEQKPLYRRVKRVRVRLRALLESEGLSEDDARDIVFESDDP